MNAPADIPAKAILAGFRFIAWCLFYTSTLLWVAALWLVGYGAFTWLRFGEWRSIPGFKALGYEMAPWNATGWVGVDRVIFHVMLWDSAVCALILGTIAGVVAGVFQAMSES